MHATLKIAPVLSLALSVLLATAVTSPAVAQNITQPQHASHHSSTGGNLVMFGDSITANPSLEQVIEEGTTCAQNPNNIPRQVARNLGLEARDFSCSGAGVASGGFGHYLSAKQPGLKSFESQVDMALNTQQLDSETRVVLIMIGFNDTYNIPLNLLDPATQKAVQASDVHNGVPPVIQNIYNVQRYNWDQSMNETIPKIQAAAPNAKIVFSGYPAIQDENQNLCLVHLGGVPVVPVELFWISGGLNNVDQWSYDASQRFADAQYVDLRTPTLPNNMCATDSVRQIPGLVDNTTQQPWSLPIHPNAASIDKTSEIITQQISGQV